jgi:hypothetical protein
MSFHEHWVLPWFVNCAMRNQRALVKGPLKAASLVATEPSTDAFPCKDSNQDTTYWSGIYEHLTWQAFSRSTA